jgi:hypothetical protein
LPNYRHGNLLPKKKALHRITVSAFALPKATSPSQFKLRNRYAISFML